MTARQNWSDDRIDSLERKVDEGFRRVDERFEQVDKRFEGLECRMENGFRELRGEMNAKFERVEERIDDINRTMLRLGSGALVTFAVGFAGLIATQL